MAVLRMTREEYQKKYGVPPPGADTYQYSQPNEAPSLGEIGTGVKNFAGGALYGISSAGRTIQNTLSSGVDKLFGTSGFGKATKEGFEQSTTVDLDTGMGKAGNFAGEVAGFAIPGGMASKAATKLPTIGRMAIEGITGGTTAALQEGEVNRDTADVAILSAIFPLVGKLATAAKVKIGESSASRIINSLIKPLKKDLSYGKDPGRAVSQEGIIASSLNELEQKIGVTLQTRMAQLEAKLEESRAIFNLSNVLDPLDTAIAKVKSAPRTNAAIIQRLENLKADLLNIPVGQELSDIGEQFSTMSAKAATDFKRKIGELTQFTGNPSDDKVVNAALKNVYGNIKDVINKKVPGVAALNERVADLISAKIATKYRAELAERQNLIKLTPKMISSMGVIGGVFSGNPLITIISLGAAGTEAMLATTRAKTELATWLVSAGNEEKKLLLQKAPWMKGIIQRLFLGEEGESGVNNNGQEDNY